MNVRKLLRAVAFLSGMGMSVPASAVSVSFDDWYEDFRRDAVEQGVRVSVLDAAMHDVKVIDSVISSDRKQPEFRKDLNSYLQNAVNDRRISLSKKALAQYGDFLNDLYEQYGVTSNYLIAFWAMETDFGRAKGTYSVFSALATLAYDTRRPDFFRAELMNALRLVDLGLPAEKMKGSWAGAMGNFQFMPTTYLAYGVDADKDGYADIFNSTHDAMASAANYLAAEGWRRGERWGREVRLPKNFDWSLIEQKKTLKEWRKLGISFTAPASDVTEPDKTPATLILPAGIEGPAFLAYPNFYVIMRWNKSVLYALSVGYLADRMKGRGGFKTLSKEKPEPFSMEDAMEIQRLLAAQGLYDGDIDGILGARTREAVRAFQLKYDLPPDGYANAGLLACMRWLMAEKSAADELRFDEIVEMQKILAKGKYYVGPFDGKLGAGTKEGVELFKRVYNIKSSKINRRLLIEMRLHAGRNMENGEVEPIVAAHHKRKEDERRAALAKRKAALAAARKRAAQKEAERKRAEREKAEKLAREKAQEEAMKRARELAGRVLSETLERALPAPVSPSASDGEKK